MNKLRLTISVLMVYIMSLLVAPIARVEAGQPVPQRNRGRWKVTIKTDYLNRDRAANEVQGNFSKKYSLASRGTVLQGNAELLARRKVNQTADFSQLSITQIDVTYTNEDRVAGEVTMSARGTGKMAARATHSAKLKNGKEFVALNGHSGVLGAVQALDFVSYDDSKGGLGGVKVEPGWLSVQLGPVSLPLTFSINDEKYEDSLDKADKKVGAAPVTVRLRSGIAGKVASVKGSKIATGGSCSASVRHSASIDGKAVIARDLQDTLSVRIEDGFIAVVTIDDADGKREFKLAAPKALTEDDKEKSSDEIFVGSPANRAWR